MIRPLTLPPFLLLILILGGASGCSSSQTSSGSQASSDSAASQGSADPASGSSNSSPGLPGSAADNNSSTNARTSEEVIGDLDAELDASVAVFDGMILDERAKAEAATGAAGGVNDSGGDGEEGLDEILFEEGDLEEGLPGYGEFPEGLADADTESADETQPESTTDEAADGAEGATAPSSARTGGVPEDISDGRDDDIVARQIREAAQKETDPVLREKLWEEYRKYKNQQIGS